MGLDTVEFVMTVEEKFGISIPDRDAEVLGTVGAVTDYVWNEVSSVPISAANWTREKVGEAIRSILTEEFGIHRTISDEDRIVHDLGLD